jgi:hypothetical protein
MKLINGIGFLIYFLVQGCASHQTVQERLPREHEYKPQDLHVLKASIQKTLDRTKSLSSLQMDSPSPH